jgi:hypothetical protein
VVQDWIIKRNARLTVVNCALQITFEKVGCPLRVKGLDQQIVALLLLGKRL